MRERKNTFDTDGMRRNHLVTCAIKEYNNGWYSFKYWFVIYYNVSIAVKSYTLNFKNIFPNWENNYVKKNL